MGLEDVGGGYFTGFHPTTNTATQYGGWFDGNGPDDYVVSVACNNGRTASGARRWAGDRRGSVAKCTSGIAGGKIITLTDK